MKNNAIKQTEIGEIPEGWLVSSVSSFAEIISGGTPITSVKGYWGGSIPWLSVVDFNNDERHVYDTEKHITEEGLLNSSTTMLKKGMLIISARGTVGAIAQVGRDMAFNQSCYGLTAKNEQNNDFLYYALKNSINSIKQKAHGSVFSTITINTFNDIYLPLPSYEEQKEIASILSSLDDKIELNRKMNKTLENIAKALFKHWFVDFEFPFDFVQGKPSSEGRPYKSSGGEMVDSELGLIPKGWQVGCFADAVSVHDSKRKPLSSMEREKRKGIYPYYGATGILDYVDEYLFNDKFILLGEDGSVAKEDGSPYTQYVWGQFWVSNHAHVLQGARGFSTEYLKVLLDSTDITPYVTGAVQPKLNQENMNAIPIIIPTPSILKTLNDILESFFIQMTSNSIQIETTTQIRDSLLPKLMSGKIRIK